MAGDPAAEKLMAEEAPEPKALPAHGTKSLHQMPELLKEDAEVSEQAIGDLTIEDALAKFEATRNGLTSAEAEKRLAVYGPNALPEIKVNKCLQFLSFMWSPLPWVMEAAALVAIAVSNGKMPWTCYSGVYPDLTQNSECNFSPPDWEDFLGIALLLIINSCVGYYEESQAGDAVAALMDQLAPECKCKRDGEWKTIDAKTLVPGDIVTIKLGDIIPADLKLLEGEEMKVDQSGLTGESLPVTKKPGDEVYSGSTIKRGELDALVHATGVNSFFGKAANLVATTESHGHLQQVLASIGNFCMGYIGVWIVILIGVMAGAYTWYYRAVVNIILVILIGGIPIAMPTVLSVTMALGVHQLAQKDAIVTRMTAVEELAGLDILCSDKTGTLTLNRLTLDEPSTCKGFSAADVIFAAALCAKREGDPDAIDKCIVESLEDKSLLDNYTTKAFTPFNPTDKRTEATLVNKTDGKEFKTTKGAPQVIIDMAWNADEIRAEQEKIVDEFALRGLRAIGVGRNDGDKWEFMGLIALFDPPRHDTKDTIEKAQALGVSVKMITGDQVAIGKETARRLGMGLNFHNAKVVRSKFVEGIPIESIVEEADGFGEVFPEDKYAVVAMLREIPNGPFGGNHVVGMTGDGVNDAPALKVADVGIAVADATDAARGAADIVLLTEGLGVVIDAIIGSREIFQRMKNYATYACATTIRIVTTFALLAIIWEFSFPPFMVLVIAYLNDGTILTISKDFATASPTPDAWRLRDIFIQSFALGLYLTASTLVFYAVLVKTTWFSETFGVEDLDYNVEFYGAPIASEGFEKNPESSMQIVALIYLQVSITGQMLIFSTRSRDLFWMDLPSPWLCGAFVLAQTIASIIAGQTGRGGAEPWYFASLAGAGWGYVLIVWVWSIVWYLPLDFVKIFTRWCITGDLWHYSVLSKKKMFNFQMHGGATHLGARKTAKNTAALARASAKP
jgi:H+-transporting ATPase